MRQQWQIGSAGRRPAPQSQPGGVPWQRDHREDGERLASPASPQ